MDETYDVVVLGTGLTECVLSGLLSVAGKKVLHIDRNDYYGGECASLTLDQVWKHFGLEGEPDAALGKVRQYNVDLVPKFLMANGTLVNMLLHTGVTRYLEFKSVSGSYVLADRRINKVPATEKEILASKLLGFWETKRFRDFVMFVIAYDEKNPKTQSSIKPDTPASALMKKFKLESGTIDVVGHAMALYTDNDWVKRPSLEVIKRMNLYFESLRAYGVSPYLYPVYGLGDLPQSFARLAAIYGGTYMLNKKVDGLTFDEAGHVNGVTCEGETAKCSTVIGDPSYFVDRRKQIGSVARCIAILDHPIGYTNDSESVQVILPSTQIKRKNDIYISMVSFAHNVAPKGKFLAIVSTTVEGTAGPEAELAAGVKYLGATLKTFYSSAPLYVSTSDFEKTGVHVSASYDATSHFMTIGEDIMRIYKQVTGEADVSYILVPKEEEKQ
eukprot:TRINITY_DN12408_c0_g1_i1.p1 TRINITY_DN12408_c0_g1~~TRINITY_DN12408_c0_g1_i1.p1  ORF type:complete len:457 (-),score=156.53 TRINITY_DN12408_c0_g1_i1:91-1419(-)